MQFNKSAIFIMAVILYVNAQIQVLESTGTGGEKLNIDSLKQLTFTVELKTTNGKPVQIYEVLATSQSIGTTFGTTSGGSTFSGTSSSFGTTTRYILTAPGKMELKGGPYTFQVSNNMLFTKFFTVEPKGKYQLWEVKGPTTGFGVLGILLAGFGYGFAIPGIVIGAVHEESFWLSFGIGSAVVGTGGIFLICKSFAKAKLIKIDF